MDRVAAVAVLLDNPVRSYAWGSLTVLAELLGRAPSGEPEAELWVGAHPGAPSTVVGEGRTLDDYIAAAPEATLGDAVVRRFGPRLPFLLKILAVERPLSVQVHPTIEQAGEGYAAEDAAGIALDSPQRSYRDRNHKPEMVVARTEFEALLGFADPLARAELLRSCRSEALVHAGTVLRSPGGLERLVRQWLSLPDAEVDALVADMTSEAAARTDEGHLGLVHRLAKEYPGDRGLLLALLMRHVRLQPGEAVFVPAGVPHAYLSGVAIEPQASSDNTLRAGLTAKHVDTAEVLRLLRYEPDGAMPIQPRAGGAGEQVYPVPGLDEFVLSSIDLSAAGTPVRTPGVVLVVAGTATVTTSESTIEVGQGQAVFVSAADRSPQLYGDGVAFAVTTGSGSAATVEHHDANAEGA